MKKFFLVQYSLSYFISSLYFCETLTKTFKVLYKELFFSVPSRVKLCIACKSLYVALLQCRNRIHQQEVKGCLSPSCLFTLHMSCIEGSGPSAIPELPSCAKNKACVGCLDQINTANLILPSRAQRQGNQGLARLQF